MVGILNLRTYFPNNSKLLKVLIKGSLIKRIAPLAFSLPSVCLPDCPSAFQSDIPKLIGSRNKERILSENLKSLLFTASLKSLEKGLEEPFRDNKLKRENIKHSHNILS